MRYFNTEGPVVPDEHYCIPPFDRVEFEEILGLIEQKRYFVLHAPRQTGKTSMLEALAERLNAEGRYLCLYIDVQPAQTARSDVAAAMAAVLDELTECAFETFGDKSVQVLRDDVLADRSPHMALNLVLRRWAASIAKPLVLLVDEIDSMMGDALISMLRQLRSGYRLRPTRFPQSVILCGVRDVRDYRIFSDQSQTYTSGGSAFNIKAKSLRLGDFSEAHVRALLAQHTAETGQAFEPNAINRVWELTLGQPWLVCALAKRACFEERSGFDRSRAITEIDIENARETLILEGVTHLDELGTKLQEDCVRRVIEPTLADNDKPIDLAEDDLAYVLDVGLVRDEGEPQIANPIYREVIPRQLTHGVQRTIVRRAASFVDSAGAFDATKLMKDFQSYFRRHSESWGMEADYKEASAQLLLHAFLQKIFNGGGRIEREYAMGRGRTDLLLLWPQGGHWGRGQVGKHVIECKVLRPRRGLRATVLQGVIQTAWYMDRCAADSGHLLVFDQRPGRSWEDRIFRRNERAGDTVVTVWGM